MLFDAEAGDIRYEQAQFVSFAIPSFIQRWEMKTIETETPVRHDVKVWREFLSLCMMLLFI